MRQFIIQSTASQIEAELLELNKQITPMLRGVLWGVILTYMASYLFQLWSVDLPLIVWIFPLVFPTMIFLITWFDIKQKKTYVFNPEFLKIQSNHSEKIKWKRVNSWSFVQEDEWMIFTFKMKFGGKRTLRIHQTHDIVKVNRAIENFSGLKSSN